MLKDLIVGGVITLAVGGTAYTVSQTDVVDNFAKDTGMSQQQAEEYVASVGEDDLIPFDELGADWVKYGNEDISLAAEIDCINYEYEWESATLSCEQGKAQIIKVGNDEIALGNSYITLSTETASESDMVTTIRYIDVVNNDLELEVVRYVLDPGAIDELKKSNSYNKSTLQAALDSDQ